MKRNFFSHYKGIVKTFGLYLLLNQASLAGISNDLGAFFNRLGHATSTSESATFKDQSAGYYTGGGIATRIRPRNVQLASIQMPSLKAGCGGIDAHFGGFSHIKNVELVRALRAIGSAAGSYAFMLAVETVSPQIYNILNELNNLATEINNFNINSCEIAATAVGGLWPKTDMANNHLCKSMSSSMGKYSDWAKARQQCGIGSQSTRDEVYRTANQKEEFKDIVKSEFNLAWKALKNYAFLQGDRNLAEFFMTLSGTLVSRKKGEGFELKSFSSLANSSQLLSALLEGGEATVYACDVDGEDRCLNPVKKTHTINATEGFRHKVQEILQQLVNKIYEDGALTESEKSFLSSTKLPVYKILNVVTLYKSGGAPIDIQEYAEIIALDIVYQYLMEVLDLMSENLHQLKGVQVDGSHIEQFHRSILQARKAIVEKRTSVFQHLQAMLSLIKKTQLMEKQLYADLDIEGN